MKVQVANAVALHLLGEKGVEIRVKGEVRQARFGLGHARRHCRSRGCRGRRGPFNSTSLGRPSGSPSGVAGEEQLGADLSAGLVQVLEGGRIARQATTERR